MGYKCLHKKCQKIWLGSKYAYVFYSLVDEILSRFFWQILSIGFPPQDSLQRILSRGFSPEDFLQRILSRGFSSVDSLHRILSTDSLQRILSTDSLQRILSRFSPDDMIILENIKVLHCELNLPCKSLVWRKFGWFSQVLVACGWGQVVYLR